ncbi:MAG: crossover junction endodeoxyribonuclease RuvC [Bacteroidaceae bacterium]|nr:crossover junction endodeoxyribonuclease RuvC [Bacteroidaceae bacterium]
MANERIVLGIDPGTRIMGYGFLKITGNKAQMLGMGVINMEKVETQYEKLAHILSQIDELVRLYKPTELAIESPFIDKNIQSTLKLGRAQGVAIACCVSHGMAVSEYAPMVIKRALTGNGAAEKEQVAFMLKRVLNLDLDRNPKYLDSTDALAAAYCHFIKTTGPTAEAQNANKGKKIKISTGKSTSWESFVAHNPNRIAKK